MEDRSAYPILSADEIATYVVCPEAWRLKRKDEGRTREATERSVRSRELRKEWIERQELSSKLRRYAKVAFLLLLALSIVVFALEHRRIRSGNVPTRFIGEDAPRPGSDEVPRIGGEDTRSPGGAPSTREPNTAPGATAPKGESGADLRDESHERTHRAVEVPTQILSLLLVLGLIIFMWDLFDRRSQKLRKESGLGESSETLSIRGSSSLPTRTYLSPELGLSSRPDALVKEGEQLIPVDLHPTATKVRDRHVISLLVHMRLVEHFEGSRPPHGLLLLGKEQRQVRIKNADEKQRWLDALMDEMYSILEGVPAVPAPSRYKCKSCDVRKLCAHSMYSETEEHRSRNGSNGNRRGRAPSPHADEADDE